MTGNCHGLECILHMQCSGGQHHLLGSLAVLHNKNKNMQLTSRLLAPESSIGTVLTVRASERAVQETWFSSLTKHITDVGGSSPFSKCSITQENKVYSRRKIAIQSLKWTHYMYTLQSQAYLLIRVYIALILPSRVDGHY